MKDINSDEIQTLDSKVVYQNRWMTVREDTIGRDDGYRGIYGVVDKPDFVVVIAIEGEDLADRAQMLLHQAFFIFLHRIARRPDWAW